LSLVVTGIGAIGPHGHDLEELAAAFASGRPLASAAPACTGFTRPGPARRVAACPADLSLDAWIPRRSARRMGPSSTYLVAAARIAAAHARIDAPGERSAAATATTLGPSAFTERILHQIFDESPELVSPFLFTDCVASAPLGQLSLALGVRGATHTICQREAGPLLALRRAAVEVETGRADLAFAGAVEELSPLSIAVLDRFRALARPCGHEELPRPFDTRRNGFLAGEGATVVTLEAETAARARAATPLARLIATAATFDPSAPEHDWGDGADLLAGRVRRMLDRTGIGPDGIDLVVSGASGARRGDRLEALVLRRVFRRVPPIVAPKAVAGEFQGVALAAAVLALAEKPFARPLGCTRPDPELGIELDDWRPTGPPKRILLTAHAAGGAAAYAVLERVD
jgi:3-oxoacyl-[acyl-carrier-protein] synthase II